MRLLIALMAAGLLHSQDFGNQDWAYGGNSEGTRYSRLKQIDRANVGGLKPAWTFDCDEGRGDSQTQPLVVNGVVYGVTPKHHIIALDGASGKLLWRFDSGVAGRGPNRGLTYWNKGQTPVIFAAVQSFVYALDAKTGRPLPDFGRQGRIDLREDLGRPPEGVSIVLTTPGIIYKDLLIVGGRLPESLPAAPGDIRAYDAHTGKLRWSFHTIPRPGEFGYDTWPKDAWRTTGAANNWPGMAVDQKRGIVFAPTGSAATDFYGYDRQGDNLFANTMLALDANTGKRLWHFQAVRHDIWDRDFPSPPTLVTVLHNGKRVDAVAQTTKQGWVYLFDRVTGEPLFPIQYSKYPPSQVPGETAASSQPLPRKPEPFARQRLTEDILTKRTPEAHTWALDRFRTFLSDGQFVPFAVNRETVIFPGFDGGAEWGGSAFDPETGLLYVNANDIPWTGSVTENTGGNSGRNVYLRNCATCHGENLTGAPPQLPSLVNVASRRTAAQITAITRQGAGRMPGFPNLRAADVQALVDYLITGENKELQSRATATEIPKYRFTGYHKFYDPDGYPAVVPPWGTLNAINLNTGDYAWKIPLGEYPELAAQGVPTTGTENYGGPLVTAGGLVFIAASNFDSKARAFDKTTGKLLWEDTLPMSGNATPATYEIASKQYVVFHATGGKARKTEPSGGVYVAYALPEPQAPVPTKGTEILWDRYGVPHIFAPDHASLFYAYGFAQMEAHSELLVRLYAQSRGRSAEYYGDLKSSVREGAQGYVETDRWVRENGIPERGRQWAAQQTPEFRKLLDAFAAGLNAWAEKHRAEMSPEARAVLPLTTADILAHTMRVIHYDWIVSSGKVDQMVKLGNTGEPHGSNGWAIAPAKSANGHAMLLSNSHLQWGDMNTYFEVQLHAPGVNSSGAVWVGFPALRLCFNDRLGWAQTTNAVDGADLYRLTLKDNGYLLDGKVEPFQTERQVIKVRLPDGTFREEPLLIRRTAQGPVVVDKNGVTAALRVTGMDRPRMLEQLWRMGLSQNLDQFQDAMRMVQLPLFNTMYADADGHIMYLFNGAVPVRPVRDGKFWSGMVPGDDSKLIWNAVHPYDDLPRVVDPPSGFVQNCNDPPWTSTYPMILDPAKFPGYMAPPPGISARAQRSIRILSTADKMTFDDLRAAKLSTHVEMADHFVDDLVALAPNKPAAQILAKWDRQAEANSDGAFLFYRFLEKAGPRFSAIGGYAVTTDDHHPLTTPRGFADPSKASAALDEVAAQIQQQYGTLHVLWGDVIRLRRGGLDLPANGAPSIMGSIRTINPGPFQNGKAEAFSGDTYVALVEFSTPVHAEALLGYGNWSRAGSKHISDQLPLMVKKVMRPSWRTLPEIEANLESKTVF